MSPKGNVERVHEGTVAGPTPFQQMIRAMANDAEADEGNFSGDDLNAILDAQTEAELWDADERPPLNFQHLAGCEIAILDFSVKYSRAGRDGIVSPFVTEDGKKMYLLASCVRLSNAGEKPIIKLPPVGEVFQANTSARFVVAKLWRAMTLGMLNSAAGVPLECQVQETDLGDGQGVLKLRPIPKRSERSTAE